MWPVRTKARANQTHCVRGVPIGCAYMLPADDLLESTRTKEGKSNNNNEAHCVMGHGRGERSRRRTKKKKERQSNREPHSTLAGNLCDCALHRRCRIAFPAFIPFSFFFSSSLLFSLFLFFFECRPNFSARLSGGSPLVRFAFLPFAPK